MKANLTERYIKSLTSQAKPFEVVDENLAGFLLRVQPTGAMTFYLSYQTRGGKRTRVKLGKYGQITLTQARELAKRHCGAVADGRDPQLEKQKRLYEAKKAKQDTVLLKDFIEQSYRPWVLKNRKSGQGTLMMLERFFAHWHYVPMHSLTRLHIESWQFTEHERGLQPASINRRLNALRSVFTRARELNVINENFFSSIQQMPENQNIRVRYLKPDELDRLTTAMHQRNQERIAKRQNANKWRQERGYLLLPEYLPHHYTDHLMPVVLLAMNTGMRRGEILQLRWTDLDFEHRRLTIRAEITKSNKVRHIPLNATAFQVLTTWAETDFKAGKLVFGSEDDKVMSSLKTAWGGLLKKANISDFRFHDLRHHFASMLVMRGADLNTVRELLGHSDFATTLRYAHLTDSHKADAVALLI
ncbi:tyrosine-type recombinase/integrase [Agitococcus lubricus]|uniref:Site-specific recombinase XerD n=1 Tax=Agitococcus lubricus TaxID=1077255 RepID=A0A2T5ISH9_9GAMM|nr:tyrosine-type recombinase/integrase [Agitococcus lubricus]PTQ86784.1 site-specific recombinase XerD [Agitococcus lubricus]